MLQRGRKSSEGLSVVRVAPHERVAPPDRLGGDESAIWREIVASKPADWFGPDNPHLEASILTSSDYDLAAGVAKKLYFLGELCRQSLQEPPISKRPFYVGCDVGFLNFMSLTH